MRFIYYLIFIIFFSNSVFAFAATDSVQVHLGVDGCNNNNICETGIGENSLNCSLDCSTSSTTTGSGGSTSGYRSLPEFFFITVFVEPGYEDTIIKWTSRMPTKSIVRWGKTAELNDGLLTTLSYSQEHSAQLNGLMPGVQYYFAIESEDMFGVKNTLPTRAFTTKARADTLAPQNPLQFHAIPINKTVTLSWINPDDVDFSYVRIMRNEGRFRTSPFDGTLIYEGKGEEVVDKNVQENSRYYYSIFARDKTGNFSSGAAAAVILNPSSNTPTEPLVPIFTPVITPVPFSSFMILQHSEIAPIVGPSRQIEGKLPITILYSNSELLKTTQDLWLSISRPSGEEVGQYLFSYQYNQYSTVLPPVEKNGDYIVTIYGYTNGKTTELSKGTLRSYTSNTPLPTPETKLPLAKRIKYDAITLVVALGLLIIALIVRRFLNSHL